MEMHSNTKNVLCCMDQNFNILRKNDLTLVIGQRAFVRRNRKNLSNTDFIVEDIRFIANTEFENNKIWIYGSAMIDYENKYLTQIALFELDIVKYQLTFIKYLSIKQKITTEKNWLIYYNKPYYNIIYTIDPLEIYEFSSDFNDMRICHKHDYQILETYISGNYSIANSRLHLCSMAEYNQDYYFILFRFYTYNDHYVGQKKRIYHHPLIPQLTNFLFPRFFCQYFSK